MQLLILSLLLVGLVTFGYAFLAIILIFLALLLIVLTTTPPENMTNTSTDYSIPVEPTANDPFMNNENDVLKVLPKFDKTTLDKIYKYENHGAFRDAGEIYSLANDRTFITYPEDDQQAFMDFLTFGASNPRGLRYEDLRTKRR